MNETLAREMFVAATGALETHGLHAVLDLVEAMALRFPAYPWLDWASDWEHEQLAKRYAA